MKRDNIRKAGNRAYFATIDGRESWKVVKDTKNSTQIVLLGNTESMLAGLLEAMPKFEELGVTVLGKKTKDGLVIDISHGVKKKPKASAK
jgi:hypothetical protein